MNIFFNKYSLAAFPILLSLILPSSAHAHSMGALVFGAILFQFIILLSPFLAVFLKFGFLKYARLTVAKFSFKPFILVMIFEIVLMVAFINVFLSYASKDYDMRVVNLLSYLSADAALLYFQKALVEHNFPWSLVSKALIYFFGLSLFIFIPNYKLVSAYKIKSLSIDRHWLYGCFLSSMAPAIFCLIILSLMIPEQRRDARNYGSGRSEVVDIKDELLRRAASIGFLRLAGIAIEEGAKVNAPGKNDKGTALHEAVKIRGNINTVKFLLQVGADVNRKSSYEFTPLMIACSRGEAESEIIDLLMKNGADINARSFHGETALKIASRRNKGVWAEKYGVKGTAIEKMLLDYGADVNLRDKEGATALMAAAEARNAELVRLLLANGADAGIRNNHGKTAYMLTSDSTIREILIKHGANPPP
jgi:hypothetical protein